MKCFFLIFVLAFAFQKMVVAQGVGTFPGLDSQNINFVAISNAPLDNLPSGTVFYSPLMFSPDTGYSINVLEVDIDVGSVPNTDGWILQMGNDGSLTPIIELSIGPYYAGLGEPPAWYSDYTSAQLTDNQVQNFLAGQLYAQVDLGSDSYLGQLLPVPEPSTIALIFCGIGFLVSYKIPRSYFSIFKK
ncbi:MAG: PEP-CTERM sorting domain-containing protein [Limisphaerales bacterium]